MDMTFQEDDAFARAVKSVPENTQLLTTEAQHSPPGGCSKCLIDAGELPPVPVLFKSPIFGTKGWTEWLWDVLSDQTVWDNLEFESSRS